MPYREERWEPTYSPKTYPSPDPSKPADIATVGFEGDPPVGYLVRQGSALEWLTNVGPDTTPGAPSPSWRYGVRLMIEDWINLHFDKGDNALEVFVDLLSAVPTYALQAEADLEDFYAQLRLAWAPE